MTSAPGITMTVHLISILEMLSARGVAALSDAVRLVGLVGDDDNGKGVSGIN
jgi:hypothetical protein